MFRMRYIALFMLICVPPFSSYSFSIPEKKAITYSSVSFAKTFLAQEQIDAAIDWQKLEDERIWVENVLREEERLRLEEEARRRQVQSTPRRYSSASPTVAVECGNTVLPDSIVLRESGGDCNAFNATGCNNRGCIGYAQLDQGHFMEDSPWNPDSSTPGTCFGLSYNECVEKLYSQGGHW